MALFMPRLRRRFLVSMTSIATLSMALLLSGPPIDAQDSDDQNTLPLPPLPDEQPPEPFPELDEITPLPTILEQLDASPSKERLADWHELFSSEPHVAGSEGDRRLIEKMAGYMESMGLEVETHRFHTYLSEPVSAQLEIVAAPAQTGIDAGVFGALRELPIRLPLKEKEVAGDKFMGHPDLDIGWNAYSASGEITAPVVYVNYGTREDFLLLRKWGIDLKGKIALARYGGNFRGFKAKFAEQEGAAGLVIFTDPADSGYAKGATYPQGGWANASYIQRGSLKTLPYSGDPLTPFVEADEQADRLDPADVALPTIPVQPIGWGAAYEILRRMSGRVVPRPWQGGLPVSYRLGDDQVELRLRVEQQRRMVETANVLGVLKGSKYPDQWVVIGSHHDAWSFGAGDPNSGTILVFEAARAFAAMAARGEAPERTLVFAHWGAEEFGIIGSTEWVEGRRDELLSHAVAYINLDGAAMGTRFSASASPSLKDLVTEVSRQVPQARREESTVYDQWLGRRPQVPFGNLGGGSDHVGFYCHLGVPSVNLSAGGSPGVSYHSNYENLHWYRKVVGQDYAGAIMLTRLVNRMVWKLSRDPLLPLSPVTYGNDLQGHLEDLQLRTRQLNIEMDFPRLRQEAARYTERAEQIYHLLQQAVDQGRLTHDGLDRANRVLQRMERQWLHDPGLPERPWFRNLFAATDPDSGYGAWMLPALRWVIESEGRPEPPPLPSEKLASEEAGDDGDTGQSGDGGDAAQATAGLAEASQDSETGETAPAADDPSSDNPMATENPTAEAPGDQAVGAEFAEKTEPQEPQEPIPGIGRLTVPEAIRELSAEQAEQLYLDALSRLDHSLDQLQALLPGEIVEDGDLESDPAGDDDPVDGDEAEGDPAQADDPEPADDSESPAA